MMEEATKICCACQQTKSLNEFTKYKKSKDGLRTTCKKCRHGEHIKSTYGITLSEYESILAQQNNCCACCGSDSSGNKREYRFSVDHNHKTGQVRGLLCTRCNKGLGYFFDDIDKLQRAIEYLIKSRLTLPGTVV